MLTFSGLITKMFGWCGQNSFVNQINQIILHVCVCVFERKICYIYLRGKTGSNYLPFLNKSLEIWIITTEQDQGNKFVHILFFQNATKTWVTVILRFLPSSFQILSPELKIIHVQLSSNQPEEISWSVTMPIWKSFWLLFL